MCGILACLGAPAGAESVRTQLLERLRRLRHRGPDASGAYVKGNSILAHQRLSIVGVEHGNQPLYSADRKQVMIGNGEIYNYKKIQAEDTRDYKYLTESDNEVIMALYLTSKATKTGVSPVALCNRLLGMFAFVLVDEQTDTFIVARDHMGIIPLYIGWDETGAMWISSELKGLHDVCTRFEEFTPGTVRYGKIGTAGVVERWYSPVWWDESKYLPTQPCDLTKLREALEASVSRRLMADASVPCGVLLSGGLDSSLISAITVRQLDAKLKAESDRKTPSPTAAAVGSAPVTHNKLQSFSVGLAGSPDLKFARMVADHIGTDHHEIIFTVEDGINALQDVIWHIETYDVTTIRASTPMYLMSRAIKARGVKMVLSGEGSDEVFGGYLYFHKAPDASEFQKETVRKLKALHKYDCLRANKSTSAWGVEPRVPFLDKEFMDVAMTVLPNDKMCGRNGGGRMEKWVLRKAFEGYLPESILWRQKEQFSDGVGYSWIDGLKAYAESKVTDAQLKAAPHKFPENTPTTKEAYLYRSIFASHFPEPSAHQCVPGGPSVACSTPVAIAWDASFQKMADPSGRAVAGVHNDGYHGKAPATSAGQGHGTAAAHIAAAAVAATAAATVQNGAAAKVDTEAGKSSPIISVASTVPAAAH